MSDDLKIGMVPRDLYYHEKAYVGGLVKRIEALEADFNSAAAAASEYSEFWEEHHGDFDQFGNYVPYSQMDGDLRAAHARIEALEAALREIARQKTTAGE